MTDKIQDLIDQVVGLAKQRGLTQRQLAENAGMSAVGLSKAKQRGDIRASSLAALGRALDLELTFVPCNTREKAAEAIKAGTFFHTRNPNPDPVRRR